MSIKRRITLGASLLGLAVSTGFLMQNSDAIAGFIGAEPSPPRIMAARGGSVQQNPVISAATKTTPPTIQLASLDAPLPQDPTSGMLPPAQDLGQRMAAVEPELPTQVPQAHNQVSAFGLPCEIELTATPKDAAMVALALSAPCADGSIVNITQGALKFSIKTDQEGSARVTVPALSPKPEFVVAFDNGAKARATVVVPDFNTFDRTSLMWQGRAGMHIHAYENGAEFGESGHIHRDQPDGSASFLTVLGSPDIPGGWSAEVLSARAKAAGVVRLHIEAEVTARTCGREISAQTLQDAETPVDLTLAIPGCDAIGDFLVLKNILHDIKLAANK